MTPLEILAVKLPSPDITEQQRQVALAEVEQQIKIYCNIDMVPDALYFTWASMAADLLRYNPDDENTGKVSGISEGDTTVNFGKDDTRERLDVLVLNYRQQLQAYRRIKW